MPPKLKKTTKVSPEADKTSVLIPNMTETNVRVLSKGYNDFWWGLNAAVRVAT